MPTSMGGVTAEILRHGLAGDLRPGGIAEDPVSWLEAAAVGGEEEFTTRFQQREAGVDQTLLVPLHIQGRLHHLRIGKAGWVEYDQAEASPFPFGPLEVTQDILTDETVALVVQSIQAKISPGPGQIGI